MIAWQQFKSIFYYSFLNEWKNKERLITPLLFSLVVILLFKLTGADLSNETMSKVLVGQVLVTCFIALQISFQRIFELDDFDGVFNQMRIYQVSATAWFTAKFLNVFLTNLAIIISLLLSSYILNSGYSVAIWTFLLPLSLALIALCPLGILLGALTLQAKGRQILFPLLYFPLSIPVLICASSVCLANTHSLVGVEVNSWIGLLMGMSVIFFVACWLLFSELVET